MALWVKFKKMGNLLCRYALLKNCIIQVKVGCVWFTLCWGSRHVPYRDRDWWESATALQSRGAAESVAFDIDGDGGHRCTCKIRRFKDATAKDEREG